MEIIIRDVSKTTKMAIKEKVSHIQAEQKWLSSSAMDSIKIVDTMFPLYLYVLDECFAPISFRAI